jgi:4-alpha-glucanotransferase
VAYTGTHDNDTIVGWYTSPPGESSIQTPEAVEAERDLVRRYFPTNGADIHWTAIRQTMLTRARAVIAPFQDVLGLGSEARMNTPGTVGEHNWTWRFEWVQLQPHASETLLQITREAGRNAV